MTPIDNHADSSVDPSSASAGTSPDEKAVLDAVDRIVRAFGNNDTATYFELFSENASFVFHNHDRRLESTEEYRQLWHAWERDDGFHVLDCLSTERRVDLYGDAAVFSHVVLTTVRSTRDGEFTTAQSTERETIVLMRSGAGWIAVHEHLSST